MVKVMCKNCEHYLSISACCDAYKKPYFDAVYGQLFNLADCYKHNKKGDCKKYELSKIRKEVAKQLKVVKKRGFFG